MTTTTTPRALFAAGKSALITGAASGVGLAVAQLCKKHGMKLALVDLHQENLDKAKQTLGGGADVEGYSLDVGKAEEWSELKKKVDGQFGGKVDLLVLNAGTSAKADWGSGEYFRKVFDTNFFGVVNGITTFLPGIRQSTSPSAVVITGSKQGITNPPGNPAYNATKAAVKSLAEGLSYELKDTPHSVHLLVPGWTYTGMTKTYSPDKKPEGAWWPEQCADYLYEKMGSGPKGSFYVICPDNDVDQTTDKKRMLWSTGDIVYDRQPLSRWRDEYKDEAAKWMAEQKF